MPQTSHALTLGDAEIRQHDGLYSLNDLHRASGGEKRHQPGYFLANDQTKALVAEISTTGIPAVTTVNGGPQRGTYACRELVIAFAAWISAAFHLKVIQVFLAASAPQEQQTVNEIVANWVEKIEQPNGYPASLFQPLVEAVQRKACKPAQSPGQIRMAFALAAEAGAQVQRTVFGAVLAGDDGWQRGRFLLSMAYGRDNQPTVPSVLPIDNEAFVGTTDQLVRMLGDPGFLMTSEELINLGKACMDRLSRRGFANGSGSATVAQALKAPSGWKDERKARALMEVVRLSRNEHRVNEIVSPERIAELHAQGVIGPRQYAKFKELMW